MVKVYTVRPGSVAERQGIKPGDYILSINGKNISDYLDYEFYLSEKKVDLVILREDKEKNISFCKDEYDDIGIEFETFLADNKKRCSNRCIFCFIDQNPKGMRETIYFKDDDTRLSFLQGNYVTLTNVTEADLVKICEMHLSPINVSVHTTDPALRVKMLGNPKAAKIMDQLSVLKNHGISLNAQIVLCRGINDGEKLKETVYTLAENLFPQLQSIAVVPAGLTKYRQGLFPLEPFDKTEADKVICEIEAYQKDLSEKFGTRFVFASDEFYLTAEKPLPEPFDYEDFAQLDNGVGMIREAEEDIDLLLEDLVSSGEIKEYNKKKSISIATGKAAFDFIKSTAEKISRHCPNIKINVFNVENRFYGPTVTVAGLLTGSDYLAALEGKELGEKLFIPAVSCRYEGEKFLDDMSVSELSQALKVPVIPMENGSNIVTGILGITESC